MDDVALGLVKDRAAAWVAWFMVAIFVIGCGIAVTLEVAKGGFDPDTLTLYLAFTGFMVVGAGIVAQRPDNAIGRIFSTIGLLAATGALAQEYAGYAYVTRPGSLPGAILAAWYQQQWWVPMIILIFVATPLLFPTGRLPSPRWRPVAAAAGMTTAALMLLTAFQPTIQLQDQDYWVDNPIGLAWIPDPETSTVGGALVGLLGACMVAAISSLVVRFRRSQGVERQQLKWVVYAGVLLLLTIPVGEYLPATIGDAIFGLIIAFLPVAAGIAILRYRLYDIDRLINRTLVYGLVTAILGLGYAGVVLLLGQLFGGVGGDPPSWAVAGATLAVAALFQPARRRIQAVVDRRFNRRKYNTAKTIPARSVPGLLVALRRVASPGIGRPGRRGSIALVDRAPHIPRAKARRRPTSAREPWVEVSLLGDEPGLGLALATRLSCCLGVMRHFHHGDHERARARDVLRG